MHRALAFAIPLALFLVFDPQWPDFERARRGVFLVLVGSFLLIAGVARKRTERVFAPLALWAGISLLSMLWAHDRLAALESGLYATALACLPWLVPEAGGADSGFRKRMAESFAMTLGLIAAFGLLQGLGLAWPRDYTVPHEAVSTFGNRNVAAEACAAIAPLVLACARPKLALVAMLLGSAYLGLNAGRAGAAAFLLASLIVLILRDQRREISLTAKPFVLSAALVIAAFVGGMALRVSPPSDAPTQQSTEPRADDAEARIVRRVGSTFEVRKRLYPATWELGKNRFPLGTAAGNYRLHFPRFRDPEEIVLSSRGHRFGTRVAVAHNDPLQLWAELGLAGLAILGLVLAFCIGAIRRGRLAVPAIAALVGWLPLALFRSPLFNAAAACALVVTLAAGLRPKTNGRRLQPRVRAGMRFLGLPLVVVGLSIVYGEWQGAQFFRAKLAKDPIAGAAALDRAVAGDPLESDWRLLRAQIHHKLGAGVPAKFLESTLVDLNAVLDRRPFEYKALIDVGYLGLRHGEVTVGARPLAEAGQNCVKVLLQLDPGHPQGLYLASEYAFVAGQLDAALKHLRRLRNEALILQKYEQVNKLRAEEKDYQRKLQYSRVQLALGKLHSELFPKSAQRKQ